MGVPLANGTANRRGRRVFALRFAAVLLLATLLAPATAVRHAIPAVAASTPASTPPPQVWLPLLISEETRSASPFDVVAPGDWLGYLNAYRSLARLTPVGERAHWSEGARKHARYMVKNDDIGHNEKRSNPWYTKAGDKAAENGNVLGSFNIDFPDEETFDVWLRGPFHAVLMLNPRLEAVGYGSYREAVGTIQMAAVLDVLRGRADTAPPGSYPVMWPAPGALVPLSAYLGGEIPDPLSSCPGYTTPSGLPIILQLGEGGQTPAVTSHSLTSAGKPIEHCVYDETSYTNGRSSDQKRGRGTLDEHDAIVLVPRDPLAPGQRYEVAIVADGRTYRWTFTVAGTASLRQGGLASQQP